MLNHLKHGGSVFLGLFSALQENYGHIKDNADERLLVTVVPQSCFIKRLNLFCSHEANLQSGIHIVPAKEIITLTQKKEIMEIKM